MKRLIILMFCFLPTVIFSQKDSLVIKKFVAIPNKTLHGVNGVLIDYVGYYAADTNYKNNSNPFGLNLEFLVYKDGRLVKATQFTKRFVNNNGHLAATLNLNDQSNRVQKILIPYYAFQLNNGNHKIEIRAFAYSDEGETGKSKRRILKISGIKSQQLQITKPETESFDFLARGIRVSSTDFKGRSWDTNPFTNSNPDLFWTVEIGKGVNTDVIFRSSMMKNAFSGGWMDGVKNVVISKGDKFQISVYDNDPMFDDVIGLYETTLPALKLKYQKTDSLTFGKVKVLYFVLK